MDLSSATFSASLSAPQYSQYAQSALILDATLGNQAGDGEASVIDINRLPQGLSVTAEEILSRLNEKLKGQVPGGIQSLNPDDYTPEKTASAIAGSITGMFEAYKRSNSQLSPEQQLTNFMKAARSGVQQGYDDAVETLEGIGAFQFDQVRPGIEQTKTLIASKLDAFEEAQRRELGLEVQQTAASATSSSLLAKAGISLSA